MTKAHDIWKKSFAEQGQRTFEEMGVDFSEAVEINPEWWNQVSRLRYSGQNLLAAFQLGMQSHEAQDPQEVFETFVEKLVGIKRANENKRSRKGPK
jgi:major membrane immunogen (membrane-anchored lipoprotein)